MQLEEIDLQATLCCNLRCGFCSVRANEYQPDQLPLKRIISLIDEAAPMGMKQLHLTGGEPALREDLGEIIARASRHGVETRLITNGTLLDRGRISHLKKAGLGNIMVSIDALEDLHDTLRGVTGTWQKAMSAVQDSLEAGLGTRISAVAFDQNLGEIPSLMQEAARMGVHIFSVFLGSPLGRGSDWQSQVIRPWQWQQFLDSLHQDVDGGVYGSRMGIIAEMGFCWPDSRHYDRASLEGRGAGCSTLLDAFDYLLVRGDGNIYQCVFFMHEGPALGSLVRCSLREILEKAVSQRLYQRFTEISPACESCTKASSCGSGCRGYSQLYHRDWHQPDPRCGNGCEDFFPICPIAKLNLRSGQVGGSSEHALAAGTDT